MGKKKIIKGPIGEKTPQELAADIIAELDSQAVAVDPYEYGLPNSGNDYLTMLNTVEIMIVEFIKKQNRGR